MPMIRSGLLTVLLVATFISLFPIDTAKAQAAGDTPPAVRSPSNGELVALLDKYFRSRQKPISPIRIAIIWRNSDLDLNSWPGELVAEAIRQKEPRCRASYKVVPAREEYDIALSLSQIEIPREDIAWERSRQALREIYGEDTVRDRFGRTYHYADGFSMGPTYVTASAGLNTLGEEQRLDPRLFSKTNFTSFRSHLEAIEKTQKELAETLSGYNMQRRLDKERQKLVGYIEGGLGGCPRWNWKSLLKYNKFIDDDDLADLLEDLMFDQRIRIGMSKSEFLKTATQILTERRPNF